jgi:hypothetical protein
MKGCTHPVITAALTPDQGEAPMPDGPIILGPMPAAIRPGGRNKLWHERVPGFQRRARWFYTEPPLPPGAGRMRRLAHKPPRRHLLWAWLRRAAATLARTPLPAPVPGEPSRTWVTPLTCPLCARTFRPGPLDEIPPRGRIILPGAKLCPRCAQAGRGDMCDSELLVSWAGAARLLGLAGMSTAEASAHFGGGHLFPPPALRLAGTAFWSRAAIETWLRLEPGRSLLVSLGSSRAGRDEEPPVVPGLTARAISEQLGADTTASSAVWLRQAARAAEQDPTFFSRLADIGGRAPTQQ